MRKEYLLYMLYTQRILFRRS